MYSAGKQVLYRDSKRNRRPTSCEQCRIRKAKCNRELPCEACIKRGERSACKYANNAIRTPKTKNTYNVGERLQRVEDMVYQLIEDDSPPTSKSPKGDQVRARKNVSISIDTAYDEVEHFTTQRTKPRGSVEPTNWLSILNDIKEVREQLSHSEIFTSEENEMNTGHEQVEVEQVDLMLGPVGQLPDIQEIIASLPPRPICDKILAQYFNSPLTLPIIHTIKFQNEYEKFWHDPTRAPPLWIGLLFSILSVASAVLQSMGITTDIGGQPIANTVRTFRSRTAQCLIMGNYTSSTIYSIETLILHLLGKYIGDHDSNFDGWFLMGNIIRLAIRLGYHRDPKHQPDISPFEGEMRRRRWHTIFQLDALLSFQMGMPSMIPTDFCDTELPHNLNDSDIHPNIESLPPSRPLSDWTPTLYTIVKGGIMGMFRKIVAHTQSSISVPSYPVTIALDGQMREAYAELPDGFKMRPVNQSFTVSSGLIISRCTIELLYLKGIIVLHRQYLNTERLDPQREYSRRACVNAALEILVRQADTHEATQPHGRLFEDRWMLSSLTAHDFLLASMVVCLELSVLMRSSSSSSIYSSPHVRKLLDALLDSQRIWTLKSAYSKEARAAALVLNLMINKVQSDKSCRPNNVISDGKIESISNNPYETPSESTMDSISIDEPGILSTEGIELPFAETMTDMISGSESLDWALLDQYLQNPGSLPQQLDYHSNDNWDFLDIGHDQGFPQPYLD